MSKKFVVAVSAFALGATLLTVPMMASAGPGGFEGRGKAQMDQRGMFGAGGAFDFAKVDADADGLVTSDELAAYRAAEIAAMDTDGDGFLSVEELTARAVENMQPRMAERATKQIERMDADGDGQLALSELPAPRNADRLFDRIDANDDGALSQDEIEAMKDRFASRRMRGGEDGRGKGRWMRDQN